MDYQRVVYSETNNIWDPAWFEGHSETLDLKFPLKQGSGGVHQNSGRSEQVLD